MRKGYLSEYFAGVTAKRLSAVEAHPERSNQHEFNGVEPLKTLLGLERQTDRPTRFVWLGDENEGFSEDSYVTWYDARERHPRRTEHRLYFRSNPVMERASARDLLIIARRPSGELMIIVVAEGSTEENRLAWLFGLSAQEIGVRFTYQDLENGDDQRVGFAARFILEELGIGIEEPEADRLDGLLEHFKGVFPTTAEFSDFARDTLPDIDPRDDPDTAVLAWMDHEEKLFRRMEHYAVAQRLRDGFWAGEVADVDGFISFSLSVQNRRKARAGYALEHHLGEIFRICELKYQRQAVTEHNSRPDFLFPGATEYHDRNFPEAGLSMLGVKSTCKDRWRQVLSEAARISAKHLLTLEPGISENQTNEMQANEVQLVLPSELHSTYTNVQQMWLMDIREFIDHIRKQQER